MCSYSNSFEVSCLSSTKWCIGVFLHRSEYHEKLQMTELELSHLVEANTPGVQKTMVRMVSVIANMLHCVLMMQMHRK